MKNNKKVIIDKKSTKKFCLNYYSDTGDIATIPLNIYLNIKKVNIFYEPKPIKSLNNNNSVNFLNNYIIKN